MIKQSKSKECSLGKLMKVYVAQMLLNAGVSSCQEQGINTLAEFLIKAIRTIGSNAKKNYELQGRQEGDIFHVLLTLNQLNVTSSSLLQYFKKNVNGDASLNRMLTATMEEIYKEKYNGAQIDESNNLRQKQQLQLSSIVQQQPSNQLSLNSLLQAPLNLKGQQVEKPRKEITEKEIKLEKKYHQYQFEEDYFTKQLSKKQQRERKVELDNNPYNLPIKRKYVLKQLDQTL